MQRAKDFRIVHIGGFLFWAFQVDSLSSSVGTVQEYLDINGFGPLFDVIVTGDRVAHGKPAPDIYLRAAELLQLAPAECAGVEDSLNGVKAVRAAGMRSVMIPDLLPYGPDLISSFCPMPHLRTFSSQFVYAAILFLNFFCVMMRANTLHA